MPSPSASPALTSLIRKLDEAVSRPDPRALCDGVKTALEEAVGPGGLRLGAAFVEPSSEKYARRLLHMDPARRYSVVVMVWGPGQGTPLHDHAGKWCVECVYAGRIRVLSYDLEGRADAPLVRFKPASEVTAGHGEAGALIPPYEYHTIRNADPTPSVTIHVYRDEMTWYNAFRPAPGGYRRERRETYYTA